MTKRLVLTLLAVEAFALGSLWLVGSMLELGGDRRPAPVSEPAGASRAGHGSPARDGVEDGAVGPRLACAERDRRIPPAPGSAALVYGAWASGGWTDLFAEPGGRGRRLGQALLGDAVEVLSQQGGWSEVRFARDDDERGWIDTSHLTVGSERVREVWRSSLVLFVVEAPGVQVEDGPFLPFGSRLAADGMSAAGAIRLLLPDGCGVSFARMRQRAASGPLAIRDALERAKRFRRVPYEAGANTRWAMDASGLVFLVFRVTGTPVPRRLGQLQQVGREVSLESAEPGDVVFLSTFDPERPQPVILLDGGDTYLAASPSIGVAVGLMSQMRNRKVLSVRRYT